MMHTEVRIAWKSLREHNIEINNFKKKKKENEVIKKRRAEAVWKEKVKIKF